MVTITDLCDQRAQLISEARQIVERAEKENRSMTDEERENYKKYFDDAKDLKARIEDREAIEREEAFSASVIGDNDDSDTRDTPPSDNPRDSKEYREAFSRLLRDGKEGVTREEMRALQQGSDVKGGFTVPPEQFIARLIKNVDNAVRIRQIANVMQIGQAASIGVPVLDADPDDADWTTELQTGSEDDTMEFGKRTMETHPLAKRIKISETLINNSALPIENIVNERLAYKFGVSQEKAFMTGTGSAQPLGLFTASANGIDTGRDVSKGNATTSIKVDGLKECKFGLKEQYRRSPSIQWVFHTDGILQISKLKDGEGRYIWQESVVAGEPDRLLNIPVTESVYAPNTFETGQYVGLLGDFSWYWILESLNFQVKRLGELYAETNQIGYIGRVELDGAPVLAEAFSRVKLA